MDFFPLLVAAALGALLAVLSFPALVKYHANRKPRAAKKAVQAVDDLIQALGEDEDDDAQRRKDELALQLRKLSDRTAEVSKVG